MPRVTLLLLLTLVLIAPAATGAAAIRQPGRATPEAAPLTDPATVVASLERAEPPADLPGNDDGTIALVTWTGYYGNRLEGTEAAWVLIGSTQFAIATIIVFPSADNAETGLGEFSRDSALTTAGDLDAWVIADRGKWICVAVDGPVLLIGQAEPVPGEDADDVRDRSCAVVAATHAWLRGLLAPGTPVATPGA